MTRKIDIKGYGGKYYITSQGDVYRRYKTCERKRKVHKRGAWVYGLELSDDKGQRRWFSINHLMKTHFFNCDDPRYGVMHKNGMQEDCSLQNLRLMPVSDILQFNAASASRARQKAVVAICSHTDEVLDIYPSAREASRRHHVSCQSVVNWCNGTHNNSLIPDFDFMWDDDYDYEEGDYDS